MSLLIAQNPWLSCAALLTLRWLAVGAAWSWMFRPPDDRPLPRAVRELVAVAAALWCGVVLNGVAASLLAEYGGYGAAVETGALATMTAAGIVTGRRAMGAQWMDHALCVGRWAPAVAAVFAVIMLLPDRGEWIVGGWDPGIYVNQGVHASRTGTFHPPPSPLLQALTAEELDLFTERHHGFTAYFPVTPIDPENRSLQPFFFRFTPSLIAGLERCGGLRAATRLNLFLGSVGALVFLGFLVAHRRSGVAAGAALLLLALHPIWVFLLHFPTSEMAHFVVLFGMAMLLPWRDRAPVACVALPAGLFAALLNRFSFFPFAGLLLCALSWLDHDRPSRGRVWRERLLQAAAVSAGVGADLAWCGIAIGRLDELTPPLLIGGFALLGLSLALEIRGLRPGRSPMLARLDPRWVLSVVGVGLGGAALLEFLPGISPHVALSRNVDSMRPWFGAGLLAAGAAGYVSMLRRPGALHRSFCAVLAFLGTCAVISLTVAAITSIYPWATRRHLVYALPFLVLCAGEWIGRLLGPLRPRPGRWRCAAALAVFAVAASGLPRSIDAWRRTEFNGLSQVLADVAAHAGGSGRVIVADHFRWGTPLHLLYGLHVLNGEYLWDSATPASHTARALEALDRLENQGWTIQWLTSTDRGLSVYPMPIPGVRARWSSGAVEIADLVHGLKQTRFRLHRRPKEFVLYQ